MSLTIRTPPDQEYLNVLLYGPPKSGKTTGACSAPPDVMLLNADLPNAPRFARGRYGDHIAELDLTGDSDPVIGSMIDIVKEVRDGTNFQTVVVDPIGELHRRLLEEASGRAIRPTLNQYGDVSTHVERFCRALCEAPVNVVIVAHDFLSKDETTGQVEHLPWTGTTNPSLGAKLMGMADVVGYTGVVEHENEEPTYWAQLINAQGRRGGDRTGTLGRARQLDLSEWTAVFAAA